MSSAKEQIQDAIKYIDDELIYTKRIIEATVNNSKNAFDGTFEEHFEAWYDYVRCLEDSVKELKGRMSQRYGLCLALKMIKVNEAKEAE